MIALVLVLLTSPPEPAAEQALKPRIAIVDSLTVKVGDREKAGDTLVVVAESIGGYFTERTDDMVRLRVPTENLSLLMSKALKLGVVVQRTHAAEDLTAIIEEQRTLLASRRDVLERYFAVLQTAKPSAVTTVEHAMTSLISEIEQIEGSLRLALHRLQLAEVVVYFQFRDRQAPAVDGSSSFEWLNTMNLSSLLGDFEHGAR